MYIFLGLIALGIFAVVSIFAAMLFRTVVRTDTVHVVQSRSKTVAYGTGLKDGNVYYTWPSWVPIFGITYRAFPKSNFQITLPNYDAYDKDRVPFVVDVVAFFQIDDAVVAAQRVYNIDELKQQLTQVSQGAVRKILASATIDEIMTQRAKFGTEFSEEIEGTLPAWGVKSVKSMELMDIRDAKDTHNVHNIMAKKTSHIEMESRIEVAKNSQDAENAEINAKRTVMVNQQVAEQAVGERTAEKDQKVGIAQQTAQQNVLVESKITREKAMEVERVNQVKQAEIVRDKEIVTAEQDAKTNVIRADGELQAQQKKATAIQAIGLAEGEAETAKQMAPVRAQTALAKEIGGNEGYQNYLISVKTIEIRGEVGKAQAHALEAADIKIIASTDNPSEGLSSIGDLFSVKGGKKLGNMVEAFAQMPIGEEILAAVGVNNATEETEKPKAKKPKDLNNGARP